MSPCFLTPNDHAHGADRFFRSILQRLVSATQVVCGTVNIILLYALCYSLVLFGNDISRTTQPSSVLNGPCISPGGLLA